MTDSVDWLEGLIRRDPARRGLAGHEQSPLCAGHLGAAAHDLADRAAVVGIVTGFAVPLDEGPVAETDGPPGAVMLAEIFSRLGARVWLITDDPCRGALEAGRNFTGLSDVPVISCPVDPDDATPCLDRLWTDEWGESLTHLIAIERIGPSHTPRSLAAQPRSGPAPLKEFERLVPPEDRDRHHTMRGEIMDASTAPLHQLFDEADRREAVRTVGICDGGNELGMGTLLWEDVSRRLPEPIGPRIVCRTRTDWTIIGGTSNWGGFALAAATALKAGRIDLIDSWTVERMSNLLEDLVAHGPAVDGCTRRHEATVDGLPFETFIQLWVEIRHRVGLES
ncbi:glutamate cyclase domain-containing protein [Maioricimonas sp. JC845]|uniref:glutamate cyclase domain-containing protein n=1 Tax=Maioricimonas sp. JC845 TaxID=3232138 RepID=UPI00345AF760